MTTKLKDVNVQFKAGPDDGLEDGQFLAYASVFGNKDSYGDIVMPGAFAESLAEWAAKGDYIPALFGHNMSDPDFNIGHVVEAVEDERGLKVLVQLALDEPKGAQVYRLIKGRRIGQMSFAYDVLEGGEGERKRDDGSTEWYYELRKLKLYEVSVVPIGANQETEILAVKTRHAVRALNGEAPEDGVKAALLPLYRELEALMGTKQGAAPGTTEPSEEEDPVKGQLEKATPTPRSKRLASEFLILEMEG